MERSSERRYGSATVIATVDDAELSDTGTPEQVVVELRVVDNRRVHFSDETVDNENLGRKSSKCCCVYRKPRNFDDPSSSSDDEEDCGGNCYMAPRHYHEKCLKHKNPGEDPQT